MNGLCSTSPGPRGGTRCERMEPRLNEPTRSIEMLRCVARLARGTSLPPPETRMRKSTSNHSPRIYYERIAVNLFRTSGTSGINEITYSQLCQVFVK